MIGGLVTGVVFAWVTYTMDLPRKDASPDRSAAP